MSFEEFVGSAQALKGSDVSRAWLRELWDGADGDLNRATNHLIDSPEDKVRRTKGGDSKRGSASASSAKNKVRNSVNKMKKSMPKLSDFPMVSAVSSSSSSRFFGNSNNNSNSNNNVPQNNYTSASRAGSVDTNGNFVDNNNSDRGVAGMAGMAGMGASNFQNNMNTSQQNPQQSANMLQSGTAMMNQAGRSNNAVNTFNTNSNPSNFNMNTAVPQQAMLQQQQQQNPSNSLNNFQNPLQQGALPNSFQSLPQPGQFDLLSGAGMGGGGDAKMPQTFDAYSQQFNQQMNQMNASTNNAGFSHAQANNALQLQQQNPNFQNAFQNQSLANSNFDSFQQNAQNNSFLQNTNAFSTNVNQQLNIGQSASYPSNIGADLNGSNFSNPNPSNFLNQMNSLSPLQASLPTNNQPQNNTLQQNMSMQSLGTFSNPGSQQSLYSGYNTPTNNNNSNFDASDLMNSANSVNNANNFNLMYGNSKVLEQQKQLQEIRKAMNAPQKIVEDTDDFEDSDDWWLEDAKVEKPMVKQSRNPFL